MRISIKKLHLFADDFFKIAKIKGQAKPVKDRASYAGMALRILAVNLEQQKKAKK